MRSLLGRLGRGSRSTGPSAPWGPLRERVLDSDAPLVRVAGAAFAPAAGAVIAPDGAVPVVRAGLWDPAAFASFPCAREQGSGLALRPPPDAPRVGRVAAFLSRRALLNYAHLLLDAAPGLLTLAEQPGLKDHALLAPPMPAWRLDLLRQVLGGDAGRLQVADARLLLTSETVQPQGMGALGTAPAAALLRVRERLLLLGDGMNGRPWLYVRPSAETGWPSPQQALIEAELEHRHFHILAPDRMSVAEQVNAFRSAKLVVGAGAAMANVLFCAPGATVIELRADDGDDWLQALCEPLGAVWRGVHADAAWGGLRALSEMLDGG